MYFRHRIPFLRSAFMIAIALLCIALPGFSVTAQRQRAVPVRIERWLSVRQMTGTVNVTNGTATRSAVRGDRLQAVGDGITTGERSTAQLEVDTGVGFVNVAEQTRMRIQSLEIAPDNGRITHLEVQQGQVRLQVRRFTHRGSELEIQTPAGVSAVRGTDFGLSVHPDGKMGVATLEGKVETVAQGETVEVPGGFQNLTIPGEPPLPAVPLQDSTELRYQFEGWIESGVRRVRLVGQVDPVNMVIVEDVPQIIDRNGQFNIVLSARSVLRVQVTVITPLGRQQVHDLTFAL